MSFVIILYKSFPLLWYNQIKIGSESMWIYIVVAIIVIIVIYALFVYNRLIKLSNMVKEAFSTMDVYLKKRWDLIPNVVETVKGYAKHEKDTLKEVIELRNGTYDQMMDEEKIKTNEQLSNGIQKIMALAEAYPELKANQNFMALQQELTNTEDKISYSRQFYNDIVTKYNTELEIFPSNIVASMFKFKSEELFKVDSDETRKNVKVDFSK